MLEGVKVVELATMVAGPAAAGLLADWGANVIKIEPHRGDPMRGAPGGLLGTINFDLANRGKRGIALDTSAPDTHEVILRLVRECDLFITNMLPEQLDKLKLDWRTLHAVNPRMVFGAISSFGRVGPDKNRGATDNLGFWARGGGTALLTVEGQDPLPIRQSVGDRLTGMVGCAGMLAALVEARATGVGQYVDTSLLASGMWAFSTDIANQANRGRTAWSKPRPQTAMVLSNNFRTKDGRWLTVMSSVEEIARATDRPDLSQDPRFQKQPVPREHHPALVAAVDEIFGSFTYAELKPRLDAVGMRAEPVARPEDVLADPQVQATNRMVQVEGQEGLKWQVNNPWQMFDEAGEPIPAPLGRVHTVGQHTIEILRELGYGEADLARMRENGTIPANAGAAAA